MPRHRLVCAKVFSQNEEVNMNLWVSFFWSIISMRNTDGGFISLLNSEYRSMQLVVLVFRFFKDKGRRETRDNLPFLRTVLAPEFPMGAGHNGFWSVALHVSAFHLL